MKAFRNKITGEWSKFDLVSEGQWGWFISESPNIHPDTCTIEEVINYCEKAGGSIDMENMELIVLEDYFEKQFLERYIYDFTKKIDSNKDLEKFTTTPKLLSLNSQNVGIVECIEILRKQLNKLK